MKPKTKSEINEARAAVCEALVTPGLNEVQKAILSGMSNALVWTAGDATVDNSLSRLLAGELIAPGKSPEAGLATLGRIERIGK